MLKLLWRKPIAAEYPYSQCRIYLCQAPHCQNRSAWLARALRCGVQRPTQGSLCDPGASLLEAVWFYGILSEKVLSTFVQYYKNVGPFFILPLRFWLSWFRAMAPEPSWPCGKSGTTHSTLNALSDVARPFQVGRSPTGQPKWGRKFWKIREKPGKYDK